MIMRFACVGVVFLAVASLVLAPYPAVAQQTSSDIAALVAGPARVQWQVLVPNEGVTLRVSDPYGEVEEFEFGPRESPTFELTDRNRNPRADGVYTWELRARPVISPGIRRELEQARETGDDTVVPRLRRQGLLPRHPLVQSASFSILGGSFVAGSLPEGDQDGGLSAVATPTGEFLAHAATTVITGDLSVNDSLCVGFQCTGAESFGFDTIRLKEDNTRIKFEDTSSTAGFPTNDWQLTANDSASGGLSKFSIEDIDHARVPFTIEANAPTNSLYVDDGGHLGFGTATPVLDTHILSNNTPSLRLEQDSSGGFTAQTWDVASNEANFFIRDVTSGSRLPFRIRPGAPTSSIDISASGSVGIGISGPLYAKLHIKQGVSDTVGLRLARDPANGGNPMIQFSDDVSHANAMWMQSGTSNLIFSPWGGNVGIGMVTPAYPLHMGNGAYCSVGGVWTNASSREYKQGIKDLTAEEAEEAFSKLMPVVFAYRAVPEEHHVGFIAEDVPEILATPDRKGLSTMDIVAVLTKVLQEQQKTIVELKAEVAELRKQK